MLGNSQGKRGIPIFNGIGNVKTQNSNGSLSYCKIAYFTNFKPSVIKLIKIWVK